MSISMTEQQLIPDVSAAQHGDIKAYERLVAYCQRSVSSIALAIVKDLDASEDITQQVFIHIWQQLKTLQNPASFLPWTRQITRYRAYNYLRDNKANISIKGQAADTLLAEFTTNTESSFMLNDELGDQLVKEQQNKIMANFINQLPEDSREIVILFYREEQNSQQVAALLGLSESNVRKKLQRVRQLLKEQLLAKYGKLILSTAPGLGLTSAICSSLTLASPPLAAASVSAASSQASGISKLLLVFGGAMFSAVAGVIAIIGGMHKPIKNANNAQQKQQLIFVRNASVVWVLLCGLLLTAAYEFTTGAWGPITAFSILCAGFMVSTTKVYQLTATQQRAKGISHYRKNLFWCVFGILFGLGAGFAGLIIGLINSGRL
ncbi:sigma-70 family RNA polymerase sigma factor [Rheinheimera sp. MMS21-TC3]|uniref:RNA polymerase sigma factor n=1 Tax=Rheinheimera sp. MMS21-TC3 TaxID=3072790 RepID=UPI0028C5037A|nr:sigma-70 family RNA polymerase sigma factor [Rheinheimera sp. MMS21-TC3]WNO61596.1 sigma-70 family RNA polymerase sigma factor [Rheinheimera sp. MMS21-TC3]